MGIPVAVLGAGSFGTCLAILCADREHDVTLWGRDREVVDAVNRKRCNPRYLKEVTISERVRATSNLRDALRGAGLVILAVPSHALRGVIASARGMIGDRALIVSTIKGIEIETGKTAEAILEELLPEALKERTAFLSGPSFAHEIARHQPTLVTVASRREAIAIEVQNHLSCPWFRCYSDTDVTGVELGGALKNVVAIATGISDGLGHGHNARAATMTRGLAEITRLGTQLGANPLTFQGLSGMGDLVLTCTGDLSRNRRVGLALGTGRRLDDILVELGEVAEGVKTTEAVCRLSLRLDVDMPIAHGVRALLAGEVDAQKGVTQLLTRQLRSEKD